MSTHNGHQDPDDMFSDTRMSFGDHLEELRLHLWRAIGGFGVAMIFSFFIANPVLQVIAQPVETALGRFWDRRVQKVLEQVRADPGSELAATEFVQVYFLRGQILDAANKEIPAQKVSEQKRPVVVADPDFPPLGEQVDGQTPAPPPADRDLWKWFSNLAGSNDPARTNDPNVQVVSPNDLVALWISHAEPLREAAFMQAAQQKVGRRPALTTLSIQEAFVVYLKVAVVCGIVIGSPWIFWQLWSFIAAGLYPHEKKLVHVYLPISLILFLGGVFICQFFVMPKAVDALLWFNEWIGMEPDLRLNEWLGFAIWMPVVFGASFQTPLIMLFLERVGILTVEIYRKQRRICWFAMAIFAALITPSVDPVSMLLMWVPMCLLFEAGIWMCLLRPRQTDLDIEVPDSDEQVEV